MNVIIYKNNCYKLTNLQIDYIIFRDANRIDNSNNFEFFKCKQKYLYLIKKTLNIYIN